MTLPTVAEYCERWLTIRSATVSKATIRGYESRIRTYITKPLGDMYLSDVTADDIRVALVPVAQKSASIYATVNMLFKCIFGNAERAELIDFNPTNGVSAKGGITPKGKSSLTDEQVQILLDPKTVQYLAGHENSKTTMDIYAQVKYNKPSKLRAIIDDALKFKA